MNKLQLEETIKKILKEEWDKKLLEAQRSDDLPPRSDDEIMSLPDEDLNNAELDRKIELESNPQPTSSAPVAKSVVGKRDFRAKESPVKKLDKDKKEFVQWVQKQFGKYLPKGASTSTNYETVFNTLEQNLTGKMPIEKLAQMFLNRQSLKKQFDRQDARDQEREAKAQKAIEDEVTKKRNKSGEEKLQQIADRFGLTKERIRQIEAEAMKKLQKKFGINFIKDIKGKEHPEFGKASSISDESEEKLDKVSAEIDEKVDRAAILFSKFIKATKGDSTILAATLDEKFNLFKTRAKPGQIVSDEDNISYQSPESEKQTIRYLYQILTQAHAFSPETAGEHINASEVESNPNNAFEFVVEYLVEDLAGDEEPTIPMFRFFVDKVVKGASMEAPEEIEQPEEPGAIDFFESSKSNNRRRTSK